MKKVLIIALCFLLTVGCGCNKKDGKKNIKKEKAPFEVNFNLSKEASVDGIKISNIQVVKNENGITNYTATITNTTSNVYELNQINLIIKNKKGDKIANLMGYVGSKIAPDESRPLNISTDLDLMKGYEIEYEIKK